jgi:amidohydrolase
MPQTVQEAKADLHGHIDELAPILIKASHEIHANPELNFEERFAHDLLTSAIEAEGLEVERHAYGLETAFAARVGTTGPKIAVICEYDALPEIGHACGHNVIAAAGLGAGLAAARMAEQLGGRVLILGTPAEEGGGGKVLMAEAGAFDDVDAAMMIHPASADLLRMNTLAIHRLVASYTGRASHACAAPQKGRNALDAAVLGYNAIAALRQHIRPDERVHGVFLKGGDKPNIVPHRAEAEWYVRSPTMARLEDLKSRVCGCLEGGTLAAGCEMEIEWREPMYADMVDNDPLLGLYAANAADLGRVTVDPAGDNRVVGSTDMGNVSHIVPSIHPMIQVAPHGVSIHTREFETFAAGPDADRAVVDGAKIMAGTIADLWLDPSLRDAVHADFEAKENSGASR